MLHFLYPLIHWWLLRLFPYLGYGTARNIGMLISFKIPISISFAWTPSSGIFRAILVVLFVTILGNIHAVFHSIYYFFKQFFNTSSLFSNPICSPFSAGDHVSYFIGKNESTRSELTLTHNLISHVLALAFTNLNFPRVPISYIIIFSHFWIIFFICKHSILSSILKNTPLSQAT